MKLTYNRKQYIIKTYEDLRKFCDLGSTAIVRAGECLSIANNVKKDEVVARFTSYKGKGRFRPTFEMVQISNPDLSCDYVLTSTGQKVKRTTLRRLL